MADNIVDRFLQAQAFIDGVHAKPMVINDGVFAHWISNTSCFWYQKKTIDGKEYRLVDAQATSNNVAFDHKALALALSDVSGHIVDPHDLPIMVDNILISPLIIRFSAFSKHWVFNSEKSVCYEESKKVSPSSIMSPDGQNVVFVRDHNLWLKETVGGNETPLTTDGISDCSYGQVYNISGVPGIPPFEALWSPNSQYIFSYQLDVKDVRNRNIYCPVPKDGDIEAEISSRKSSYPGDEIVESYQLVIIDVTSRKVVKVAYGAIPLCRLAQEFFSYERLGWWSIDSQIAYFVNVGRGAKSVQIVSINADSGSTKLLHHEVCETFISLSHSALEPPIYRPLPESNELIWFSESDGWGHLYLYDLQTGQLKNQITVGDWVVREILYVYHDSRELLVQTSGRSSLNSPYYRDICIIEIDTGKVTTIADGPYEHMVYGPERFQTVSKILYGLDSPGINGVSSRGDFIVTTRSRVDSLPVSVLLDRDGNEVMLLEAAEDIGLPNEWEWPEPFSVRAHDDSCDLYGVMFRPPGFSPEKKYPVLDYRLFSQLVSTLPQGSFINDVHCGENYAMGLAYAALGFIVVCLEVPGMPCRDKKFHDQYYAHTRPIGIFDDSIFGIRQLAKKFPYMDLTRVGIVSVDGDSTPVYGLLEHPDFYSVGVCVDFDDPRFGFPIMTEVMHGVKKLERPYDDALLSRLEGKLLLIHGMRGTPPEMTFQLVDALQKLHKDFDMIIEPDGAHAVTDTGLHHIWRYLVTHLLEDSPPKSFPARSVWGHVSALVKNYLKENAKAFSVRE